MAEVDVVLRTPEEGPGRCALVAQPALVLAMRLPDISTTAAH